MHAVPVWMKRPTLRCCGRPLAFVLICALTIALNGHNLMGRWRFDDAHHLLFLTRHSNFEYLYDFSAARLQSGAHLTPFNIFTYDIAHRIFGLKFPAGFYAVHLTLIAAAACAFHGLMRRVASPLAATAAVFVFLAGFPMLGIASQLMVGHYVLGAAFISISLAYYDRHVGTGKVSMSSLLFYFLACLSKEIYLPFAGLVIIDPRFALASRLRVFAWYAGVAAVYWLLRSAVLGQVVGGYNAHIAPHAALFSLASGFARYFTISPAMTALGVVFACGLTAAFIVARNRFGTGRASVVAVGAIVIAFVPLMAVPAQLGPEAPTDVRLWLAPWFLFSACAAFAFDWCRERLGLGWRKALTVAVALVFAAQYIFYESHSSFARITRDFDSVSRAVESERDCHLVDQYGWSSWIHDLGETIRPGATHPVAAPRKILDVVAPQGAAVCELKDGQVVHAGFSSPSACSLVDPMSITISHDGANVAFSFGPEKHSFYFVDVSGKYFLWLPADYFGPMPNIDRLRNFRVLRIAPEGHVACSPWLHFDPRTNSALRFSRNVP